MLPLREQESAPRRTSLLLRTKSRRLPQHERRSHRSCIRLGAAAMLPLPPSMRAPRLLGRHEEKEFDMT
jgi:hypothetical protein